MRSFLCFTLLAFLLPALAFAQIGRDFPTDMEVCNPEGVTSLLSDHLEPGKTTVIAVWATWCKPCHLELDAMMPYYESWTKEKNTNVLAISMDQGYQINNVAQLVQKHQWPYPILVESNRKLQQALGFTTIPQLFIVDGTGKIIEHHDGYEDGQEKKLDKRLDKIK